MEKYNEKIKRWMTMILIAILVNHIPVFAQDVNRSIIPEGMNMESRVPAGTIPASSMDLTKNQDFTGNVSVPIPLVSLGGVDVQLKYYSKGIANEVKTENQYAPSGVAGIGWQLVYGSISAEINNTIDTTDDKYFFNGPDGSFELQESSNGTFFIPDYKAWKIQRVMDGYKIAGWEITKEDGTVYRYGNYDRNLTSFTVDYAPTNATRFLLGVGGIVINASASLYDSVSYVPYQWDISCIEDVRGNQTTIEYLPNKKQLITGSNSTGMMRFTSESYPFKIMDNRGGVIEFNYGDMVADEYYNFPQTYMQNLFGTKFLDSIKIRGVVGTDTTTFKKIVFVYNSLDICGLNVKKRYLIDVKYTDGSGNALPSYKFGYYTSSSDINPGAIQSITDPKGGKVTYTYSLQQLPNVDLQKKSVIPTMVYYNPIDDSPNDDGLIGKDFLVVRGANNSLTVYRKQSTGWELDTSFPFSNSIYIKVAGDYVLLYPADIDTMYAIKRVAGGWQKFNVNQAIIQAGGTVSSVQTGSAFAGLYVIGSESNYFVVKYNMTGDYQHESIWDVAVINFNNCKLTATRLTGYSFREDASYENYPNYRLVGMRAFCGQNYFVIACASQIDTNKDPAIGTNFHHFRYSSFNNTWNAIPERFVSYFGLLNPFDLNKNEPHRAYIGKNFIVLALNEASGGKTQFTRIKVYKKDGTSSAPIDTLIMGDPYTSSYGISKIVVADDYYAYTYLTSGSIDSPDEIGIRVWNGTAFNPANLNFNQIFADSLNRQNVDITAFGNRLVVNWGYTISKVGSIIYSPATNQWSQGVIHHSKSYGNGLTKCLSMNNNTLVEMYYGPTLSGDKLIVTNAYQFQGNSVKVVKMDSLRTSHSYSDKWIWQTGNNTFAIALIGVGSSSVPSDSLHIYTLNNLPNSSMEFTGNPTNVVVSQKTISAGMGTDMAHSYSFQNGVLNEYSTPEFRKVVETLPDNNGKVETSYYTSKDSVVNQKNMKYLSGTPYNIRELNNQEIVVRETQKNWVLNPIDTTHAVYFHILLSESVITDNLSKSTAYEYQKFPYFQIKSISETNSDGSVRKTEMKYAQDYDNTGGSIDTMVQALDLMKNGKHIYNAVIEKTITNSDSSQVYSGELNCYKVYNSSQILPWKRLGLKSISGDVITDYDSASASSSSFNYDSRYLLLQTMDSYDTFGNLLQSTNANGIPTTTKWNYNNNKPVAVVKNAINSECDFIDMENGFGNWETGSSSITISAAHTGLKSALSNNDYGPTKNFTVSNLDRNKTYILEGWVNRVNGLATFTIEMRNAAHQGLGSKTINSSNISGWQKVKVEITPQDMASLPSDGYLRVWCGFIGAGNYGYVDDVRFQPAIAEMVTMTYDPISLLITGKSDENSKPVYLEYDSFGRPIKVYKTISGNKVLTGELGYYYSREGNGQFSSSNPNSTATTLYDGSGNNVQSKEFYDGLGRKIQHQIRNGSNTIVSYSTTYDSNGRIDKNYKSYENSITFGQYDPNFVQNSGSYNSSTNGYPFSETSYFSDPLGRVYKQSSPGYDWRMGSGKEKEFGFSSGTGNGLRSSIASYSYFIETSFDEQELKNKVYKDIFGRMIASVQDPDNLHLETNFAYNQLDKLVTSTDPAGKQTIYSYNTLGQLIQKTSPDAGTVNYKYDKNGNVRFVQDANQAASGKFTYNKYDPLNRLIETGEYSVSGSLTQTNADDVSFPTSSDGNKISTQQIYYDIPFVEGQKNLIGRPSKSLTYRQGTLLCTELFSYYDDGKVEFITRQISGASDTKITYNYNNQGNVIKKCVTDLGSNTLYTFYTYDPAGRLKQVWTNTADNQTNGVKEAEYNYNANGQPVQLALGNTPVQTVDYNYNQRDWLTAINNVVSPGSDKFAEELQYNTGSLVGSNAQFNGNIAAVKYYNAGIVAQPLLGFGFTYDAANRLTSASTYSGSGWSSATAYALPAITYDAVGNINTMQRRDASGTMMHNFSYSYPTTNNHLTSITNSVNSAQYSYTYDNNGNVVSDQMRGVSNVIYNTKNLPEQLTTSNGTVNYSYDAGGNRIRKVQGTSDEQYILGAGGETEAVFNGDGTVKFFNIFAGSEVIGRYEPSIDSLKLTNRSLNRTYRAKKINAEINVTVPVSAKFKVGTRAYLKPGFTTAAGSNFEAKVDAGVLNPARYYYLKDHLGSVRVTVDQTGEVVSFDDYDAWGMQLSGRSNNLASEVEKYKYVGNERDEETGYDYLGDRSYDSRIGGLLSVDPFAHKDPSRSPYSYAANNPILFYDEKGDSVSIITSGPTYTNTPSAISTPGSLVGHTAINIDGKVYSFDGTGHWSVKSYNDYISNEKQVRSVIEQTVDVDQSKVQVAVNNREDGKYNVENNSCVTNTMNFLSAGGMQFNKPNGAVTPEQLSNSLQNSGFVSNAQRSVSLSSPAIIGLMTYRAAELLMNSGIWNPLGVKLNTVPLLLGK